MPKKVELKPVAVNSYEPKHEPEKPTRLPSGRIAEYDGCRTQLGVCALVENIKPVWGKEVEAAHSHLLGILELIRHNPGFAREAKAIRKFDEAVEEINELALEVELMN